MTLKGQMLINDHALKRGPFLDINLYIVDHKIYLRDHFHSFLSKEDEMFFFKFKDNLFSSSQSTTFIISSFMVLMRSSGSFPDRNIFESSANNRENIFLDTLLKSLIYSKNNKGPRIEPCGTPNKTLSLQDDTLWYSTYCTLPDK